MKIHLLIADMESDYVEHLSRVLTENYADVFEVSVCSSQKAMADLLEHRQADIALLGPSFIQDAGKSEIRLPLLLWDGTAVLNGQAAERKRIRKYQRISALSGQILEEYAEISSGDAGFEGEPCGKITVVWSPAGGCGKTTAALAYAAQKVSEGKKAVYLDLEPFSSTPVYFAEGGKSISSVFEKLDGNVELLLQSIRQTDGGSGIFYFGRPDNYDDIEILTDEDMRNLVVSSAKGVDEVIVDIGEACGQRTAAMMDLADTVMAVIDNTRASHVKWRQFCTQHSVYEKIRAKLLVVANRGARLDQTQQVVSLPLVQSEDPLVVYKTLSAGYFNKEHD